MQVIINGVTYVPACASASRIGIAITTHNRPDVLKRAIEQHTKHLPIGALVVVIDDGSKPAAVVPDGVQLLRHETSLGIVASKNASLSAMMDAGCEHLFLWDDDAWPIADTASGGIQSNSIALITSTLAQVDQQVRLSAQYGDSKASIDRIDNVMASDREATARSLLSLQTDVNGNKAAINSLNQTFSNYQQATTTQINGITATINGHTSAITTNAQAIANVNGDLKAMYSIKVAVDANGKQYAAGMGIGVENTPSGMQSQVLFVADRFAVMAQAGGAVSLPFVIQNGQTFIRDTFIQDGTISNAKIGSYIQSSTWDGTGNVGWHINKSGYATFNNVTVRGSIYATNGNFSFNGSGNTTVINGNGVTINIPGGGRIVLGTW